MKKLTFLMIAFLVIVISCKKSDDGSNVPATSVCAKCEETNSHYKPDDYCGTPASVDLYINTLKDNGAQAGQNWVCTKD
jgi:hypothetical protein